MVRICCILCMITLGLLSGNSYSQAVFTSNGSGNWSDPSSWTLVSGSSSQHYPVSGDSATITASAAITVDVSSQCNELTINGGSTLVLNSTSSALTVSNSLTAAAASLINIDLGLLTVTGSMTVGGASTITITQGALTVVGLMILNAPTSSTGNTLLDVSGGAFSCAGGMTITATTPSRTSELRIGNSAVNIVGGLATISGNAHIDFSGTGALTLAGAISIPNAASFDPGAGRVVYVGIPGSNQTIAPLTYYRLVITGFGSGTKQIGGAVVVTDTLTLLSDTMMVNGSGSLTLNNGATIVRTGGKLLSAPVFMGTIDLLYNDVTRDTTGAEMPTAPGVLHNLAINDIAGIDLGASITVNNLLDLQQGPLITNNNILYIANGAGGPTTDPAVTRTNGYVMGIISRTISATTGVRIFPFGTGGFSSYYRAFNINYTTAPTAGILTVQHADSAAPAQSGLPLTDGAVSILHTAPLYWQADASGGLSGGTYTLTLTGEGTPGVSNPLTLRTVKRPSTGGPWILDGTAGTNSGTNAIPLVVRQGMSGFSQFTFGSDNSNTLPITLLYFSGRSAGNDILLSWATSSENDNKSFTIEHGTEPGNLTTLGQVPAAGTAASTTTYSYTDNDPATGKNYYRLKQTDLDGKYTYSNVIVVYTATPSADLKVYPSITSYSINITPDLTNGSPQPIQLFNAAGQYIRALSAGANDIGNLAKGIYFVKRGDQTARFIKE